MVSLRPISVNADCVMVSRAGEYKTKHGGADNAAGIMPVTETGMNGACCKS